MPVAALLLLASVGGVSEPWWHCGDGERRGCTQSAHLWLLLWTPTPGQTHCAARSRGSDRTGPRALSGRSPGLRLLRAERARWLMQGSRAGPAAAPSSPSASWLRCLHAGSLGPMASRLRLDGLVRTGALAVGQTQPEPSRSGWSVVAAAPFSL